MTRVACIDIGTVTARLAVADVEDGRVVRLAKRSQICNLGQDVDKTHRLRQDAMERVFGCVAAYLEEARRAGATSACCTLTSAARDAQNARELGAALASLGLEPMGACDDLGVHQNELVINLKDSSVLSVIGVVDLMFATTTIAGKYYKQMEIYVVAMAVYLVLTMVASKLLGLLAKRLDAGEPGPVLGTSDVLSTKGTVSEEH